MKTRLKHITFTGIDAQTDIERLRDIQRRYPIAEFGVLTSYHWYKNGNRYLDPRLIDERLRCKGLRLALHVCGSAAHDAAVGKWDNIDKLTWMNLNIFKRVQINIAGRKDNPKFCWVPLVIGQELIVQQKADIHLPEYHATLHKWRDKRPYHHRDTISALLDSSGGRGIDTKLKVYPSNEKIGYAGGISPDNVEEKLRFLMSHVTMGEFWIDMESGVRTDDWFDLDKVEKVLNICEPIIKQWED